MKRPKKHHPGNLVPEYLTTRTIEGLTLDKPVFIQPGDPRDDFEPPAIFITSDRRLRMDTTYAIDGDDAYPESVNERVGVMKTFFVDPTNGPQEYYVADLRFIDNYNIVDLANPSKFASDQEAYVEWLNTVEDSITFGAFIAPEFDDEYDYDEDAPSGVFYGMEELYPSLKILRKKSNKVMKRYMERETRRIEIKKEADQQEQSSEPEVGGQPKVSNDKPKTLEIRFSHGNQ